RAHVRDAVHALEPALDLEQRRGVEDDPRALVEGRGDDGVRRPGLVLEGQEAHALRRARALADDDVAGDAHPGAVRHLLERARCAASATEPSGRAATRRSAASARSPWM